MYLSEIFEQLRYGELSQLRLSDVPPGEDIPAVEYPKLVSFVNSGLTALYSRFPLKRNSLTIRLIEGVTNYPIHPRHVLVSNKPVRELRYIDNTVKPFLDDLLRIEEATLGNGTKLKVDDYNDEWSITTPEMATVKVPLKLVIPINKDIPEKYISDTLEITYRARHPKIVIGLGYFDPARIELELPYSHLQALLFYVASRAHSPIGMAEEGMVGSGFFAKYENECRILESLNMTVDNSNTSTLLNQKGFI